MRTTLTMKVAIILPLLWVTSNGAFMKDVIQEEDWSFQTKIGETITFHCNDSLIKLEEQATVEWVLPNEIILSSAHKDDKYVVGNEKNITGNTLMIYDVEESDSGLYLCCIEGGTPWCKQHTIRGLNMAGHKIKNPFDKYENNLIVAVVAALVLFVPLVAICLIYKYRYLSEDEKIRRKTIKASSKGVKYHSDEDVKKTAPADGYYDNPSYNNGMDTRL
ncbi:hypothetical protein ScPMuIL_010307 [Solemya velum]